MKVSYLLPSLRQDLSSKNVYLLSEGETDLNGKFSDSFVTEDV